MIPKYTYHEAAKLGYVSITHIYKVASLTALKQLETVLLDLAGCDHCLIEAVGGYEVGRKKSELIIE